MISLQAKSKAISVMEGLGLHPVIAEIGEIEIPENVSVKKYESLKKALRKEDFELVNNKENVLAEKIKYLVIEMIYYAEELPETNFSDYISNKLHLNYSYLSRCFSKIKSITIERFIIAHKIERTKQLLLFNGMTLSEIAWKLQYSSTSHLSSQFKKVTGLTPSLFKKLKFKKPIPQDIYE